MVSIDLVAIELNMLQREEDRHLLELRAVQWSGSDHTYKYSTNLTSQR